MNTILCDCHCLSWGVGWNPGEFWSSLHLQYLEWGTFIVTPVQSCDSTG